MFRGRIQLGREIRIGVQCRNGSRTPAAPDAAPTWRVYAESGGSAVGNGSLPPTERYLTTGIHEYMLFLGTGYSAGRYYVRYNYAISGTTYTEVDSFEILAAGTTAGQVISLAFLDRADGDWILAQTDAGNTSVYRGPHT